SALSRAELLASVRSALRRSPDAVLRYGDPRGVRETREALARYVARTRGVDASAEAVVVCNGFTQALSMVVAALRDGGATTLAVEDPSIVAYRDTATRAGLGVH